MSSVSPKVPDSQASTNSELLGIFRRTLESGDTYLIATGAEARRMQSDLDELRALRRKQIGGSVYKRKGSRYWQIQYFVNGEWRQESSRTENYRDADALLRSKVYMASAGTLPGTATFEQVIDALVDDARVRGNKAAARLAGAARALKARLAGYRAEACNYAVWLKYAAEREREATRDTMHLELSVAKRAYKLAHVNGLNLARPGFSTHPQSQCAPRLHRSGTVDEAAE